MNPTMRLLLSARFVSCAYGTNIPMGKLKSYTNKMTLTQVMLRSRRSVAASAALSQDWDLLRAKYFSDHRLLRSLGTEDCGSVLRPSGVMLVLGW